MLMSEDMEEKMEKTLPILPTLKDIEQELSGYIKADKSNWARIYKLMNAVDKGKLYLQRPDTPSFTSIT